MDLSETCTLRHVFKETEPPSQKHVDRHDRTLSYGVDWRVGDLSEELLEVGIE